MRTADRDQKTGWCTVSGSVTAAGAIAGGSGFNVQKVATGNYTLRFDDMTPIACATSMNAGSGYIANAIVFLPRQVSVVTINAANSTATDQAFTFVATGVKQ